MISANREDDESYTVAFTREGGGDIGAPAIRSVSNGVESLTVYWNAPDTSCPGDIDHYNLRYSLDQDDADWTEVRGPSGSLSHTIRGLHRRHHLPGAGASGRRRCRRSMV